MVGDGAQDVIRRIHSLYVQASASLDDECFYDTFICMFEREKYITRLSELSVVDTTLLHEILRETQEVATRVNAKIEKYLQATANLSRSTPALLAYAQHVEGKNR